MDAFKRAANHVAKKSTRLSGQANGRRRTQQPETRDDPKGRSSSRAGPEYSEKDQNLRPRQEAHETSNSANASNPFSDSSGGGGGGGEGSYGPAELESPSISSQSDASPAPRDTSEVNGSSGLRSSWLPDFTSEPSRADAQELEAEHPKYQRSSTSRASIDRQPASNGKGQQKITRPIVAYVPPEAGRDLPMLASEVGPVHPAREVENIKKAIINSAMQTTKLTKSNLEHEFRGSDGVVGALQLLLGYHDLTASDISTRVQESVFRSPAYDKNFKRAVEENDAKLVVEYFASYHDRIAYDIRNLQTKVREAAGKVVGQTQAVNSDFDGNLKHLISASEHGNLARSQVGRMGTQIRAATTKLSRKAVERVDHKNGIEGVLELLINDYKQKSAVDAEMSSVEHELRTALNRVPGITRKLDRLFQDGNAGAAVQMLVEYYQPYLAADERIRRIDKESQAACRGIIDPAQFRSVRDAEGLDAAIKLLFGHLHSKVTSLNTQVEDGDRALTEQISRLKQTKNDLHDMKAKYGKLESDYNNMHRNLTTEISEVRTDLEEELKAAKNAHAEELADREKAHDEKLRRQRSTHRLEVENWDSILQKELEKYSLALKSKEAEMQRQKDDFEMQLERLSKNHEEQKERQRLAAIEEQEGLRREASDFRDALVARQHTKGITDSEIGSRFRGLLTLVDILSRLQWDKKKESNWPTSESVLIRSSKSNNPSKLKRMIMQSAIWFVLNERLFTSPFGIFGSEGQEMHRVWARGAVKDRTAGFSHWPEASEGSEEIRSQEINRRLDGMKKADTESNKEFKNAYEHSIIEIADMILKAIGHMVETSAADERDCQQLVRTAADFWLDVSAHKCRITLHFPSPMVNVLEKGAMSGKISLVAQPEVRRKGTAKGERLDREQVVKDCEGDCPDFQPGKKM